MGENEPKIPNPENEFNNEFGKNRRFELQNAINGLGFRFTDSGLNRSDMNETDHARYEGIRDEDGARIIIHIFKKYK